MEVRFLRKKEWKYILLLLWQTGNNQTYFFIVIMLIFYSVLSTYFSGCPSSYYCLIFIHLHGQNWNDRNKVFYYWQGYNYLLIYLSYKE